MKLKTRSSTVWPSLDKVRDPAVSIFLSDLGRLFTDFVRNLHEDLTNLQGPENVDALPTAAAGLRGRILNLKGGAGVADIPKICIKDAADAYVWKTIDLS